MERLRAVLFDMDGTLVDSNPQNTQAWMDTLTEGGYPVTYEQIYSLIGMGGDNLLPMAVNVEKESETGKKLSERWKTIFIETYLPQIKPPRKVKNRH